MSILTDLFYLPSLEYFAAVLEEKEILVDAKGFYQKQTYRNRTQIRLANKVETLSIPVLGGNKKQLYKEVKIDYGQKWKNVHIRGIQSAYGKAPFFEYFFPYIEKVYDKNYSYLFDLNWDMLTICLKLLRIDTTLKVFEGQDLGVEGRDIRGIIHSKQDFTERGIYQPYPYQQLFGVNFVPNLSVLDLLFCEGPDSKGILSASQKKTLNNR